MYARRTLWHLTTCTGSLFVYRLSPSETETAAHSPPTPATRVTAVEVDGAGPIGRTRTGIGFLPRTEYEWTYLKRAPNQSQSPSRERLPPSVTSGFEGLRYARYARAQTNMWFWSLCPLVWGWGLLPGGGGDQTHCAPVGRRGQRTAPRLGVGPNQLPPGWGWG